MSRITDNARFGYSLRAAAVTRPLEIWGGIECTVNRVQDTWYDQLVAGGHAVRGASDIELIAGLGIRKLRYPILWETHADPDAQIWTRTDACMARIRDLGIEPIVGLLHHGSGPAHTSLLDEHFPAGLAAHARRVALRYPWVNCYTPINEPLTTARFSTLYGLWYPHARDDRSFARAVINQCRAIGMAMAAIRQVNPIATLLQTEDVGRIYGTSRLQYQVELENERRWMTWDLLSGRLLPGSRMYRFLREAGVGEVALAEFAAAPCQPEVLGINHYVTSDRFLDEHVGRFAPSRAGGNGRDRYADVEAVRSLTAVTDGWQAALDDTWARYGLPIVIAEAHLGCSREEQLRWLADARFAADDARKRGVDVRAVTAWALFGSYNWGCLLTRDTGEYEPGAFDVRSHLPRATALSQGIRDLSHGMREPAHPVAQSPGWWYRDMRIAQRCIDGGNPPGSPPSMRMMPTTARPLLIAGADSQLGTAFVRLCRLRGLAYRALNREMLDICSAASINDQLTILRPWAIVNTTGFAGVDAAESEPARCFRENSDGPRLLAEACADRCVSLVTFSSDLVFDGVSRSPYVESSSVAPLNVYGHSKARAERDVMARHGNSLVIRVGTLFGPHHADGFLNDAMRALARRQSVAALDDVVISPTYVPDLVAACLDLLIDGERGIWHLANTGPLSCAEFVREGARLAGLDPGRVIGHSSAELARSATRPAFSALATERGFPLPQLQAALHRHVNEGKKLWSTAA